ncbi:amino acid transporter [Microthyrium microscopicum]|uniref:Amino acid transporter n=1 Tax=Microthyrium microscopicum TaxID=703497 RepID=A0A6A6TTZ3_9PEZI|nr:amino acid transporter [Microthyrium microscopicum]
MVMFALGEMATWLPLGKGFAGYATRFVDPALGFALGYSYWFKYLIVTPNQLTAAALVIQYWVPREKVNPGVFITVFLLVIIFINYFGIRWFGEFEFWLSSFKVVVLLGLILLTIILALGGGPDHDRKGFRYWKDPGAFKPYPGIANESKAKFVAFWSVMVIAVFAYLGTELIGVTVGEAQNPRRNIPRAIKLTFWRILFFYVVLIFFLGMIIPYNSDALLKATKAKANTASASPFVAAIVVANIRTLPGLLNVCILFFILSASNSDLYIATRTIYGIAKDGKAPHFLCKTDKRGVPIYALLTSACFCLLAYLNVSSDSSQVFTYFVNLVTIFGLLSWISILVSHIYFVRARKAQNIPEESLHYKSPFGIWGSYIALGFCCLIAITKSFTAFMLKKPNGEFDGKAFTTEFITSYIGIPVYLIMLFGYKFWFKTKGIKPHEADLFTGKDAIDREEEIFLQHQALRGESASKMEKFYDKTIGLVF